MLAPGWKKVLMSGVVLTSCAMRESHGAGIIDSPSCYREQHRKLVIDPTDHCEASNIAQVHVSGPRPTEHASSPYSFMRGNLARLWRSRLHSR